MLNSTNSRRRKSRTSEHTLHDVVQLPATPFVDSWRYLVDLCVVEVQRSYPSTADGGWLAAAADATELSGLPF